MPRASTAILAALVAWSTACGPSGPAAAGSGDGGGDTGAGENPGGDSGQGGGAEPRWVTVIGGLGSEYLHDVAAVGGDALVALNLVGVQGERVDELGLHRLEQPDGREAWKQFHRVNGVPIRVAPGAFAGAGGESYAAFTATCSGQSCPRAGGVTLSGAALVKFSSGGEVAWARALRGAIASGVAASPDGAVVVTEAGGVAVVHRFRSDGALAWESSVGDAAPASVALTQDGDVVLGAGGALTRLGSAGNRLWRIAADGGTEDVAVSPPDTIVSYGSGAVTAYDGGGGRRWQRQIEAGGGGEGAKRLSIAPDGRISVLAGGGCGAAVARLTPEGELLWSRRLVRGGCGDGAIAFFGHAATADGAAVSGAIRSNDVDLGIAHRDVSGPVDGFVLRLGE